MVVSKQEGPGFEFSLGSFFVESACLTQVCVGSSGYSRFLSKVGLIVQSKLTGGVTGCLSLRVSPVTD